MSRLTRRTIGIVPLALLIAVVVGVPAASAKLPEFGRCVATESGTGGHYTDAACVERAHVKHGVLQGSHEWQPLEEHFNERPIELEGPMVFETASGAKLECATSFPNNVGTLTGPRQTITPLWILENCTSEGQECHSAVSINEGEISNENSWLELPGEEGQPDPGWEGSLGFVSKTGTPVVGIEYAVKNHERAYPPISCRGALETIWIGGDPKGSNSFASTIGPVDEMTTSFTETLSESAPGIVSPAKISGHHKVSFEAFLDNKWEPVAMVGSWHEALEEGELPLEIKAKP
jgi:hypothetical protein